MIPTILKCWHGEEKLYIVFWVWGVLVGTFISFVMEFLWWPYGFVPLQNIRFGKSFESIGYFNLFLLLVILVLGIICLLYWIWVIISIWRCSWNVKNKKWGWAARIVVSLAVVLNFVSIILTNLYNNLFNYLNLLSITYYILSYNNNCIRII